MYTITDLQGVSLSHSPPPPPPRSLLSVWLQLYKLGPNWRTAGDGANTIMNLPPRLSSSVRRQSEQNEADTVRTWTQCRPAGAQLRCSHQHDRAAPACCAVQAAAWGFGCPWVDCHRSRRRRDAAAPRRWTGWHRTAATSDRHELKK